jgi:hypothetical protein
MATTKRRNLFLYLTLVCFFGLIAVFIVDGYMGIYDTIYITAGEREQRIESDVWQRGDMYWSTGVNRGERAFFRYEVDNRLLSTYAAAVEVSVWRMQAKIMDVTSEQLSIGSFAKHQVEWALEADDLIPANTPQEQSLEYTVMIKRGDLERNVILFINPTLGPPKPLPAPPR